MNLTSGADAGAGVKAQDWARATIRSSVKVLQRSGLKFIIFSVTTYKAGARACKP